MLCNPELAKCRIGEQRLWRSFLANIEAQKLKFYQLRSKKIKVRHTVQLNVYFLRQGTMYVIVVIFLSFPAIFVFRRPSNFHQMPFALGADQTYPIDLKVGTFKTIGYVHVGT